MEKSNFTYEDIFLCLLPKNLENKFLHAILVRYDLPIDYLRQHTLSEILDAAGRNSYHDTFEYNMATTSKERAIVAMNGPKDSFKTDVLELWLEYAKKYPDIYKALNGWTKV